MLRARQLATALLLWAHAHLTAREVARALRVSERTVARDCIELMLLGVSMTATRGPGGGYEIDRATPIDLRRFVRAEAAQSIASAVPAGESGVTTRDAESHALERLRLALLRIAETVPPEYKAEFDRALQDVLAQQPATPAGEKGSAEPVSLPLVRKALWTRRGLRITYPAPDGEEVERFVEPCVLVARSGEWHLLAFCHRHQEMRVFSLTGVREATLLDEAIAVPDAVQLRGETPF